MTASPFDKDSPLPPGWRIAIAGDFRRKRSLTFNPRTANGEQYELWSIPSYTSGSPEIVAASDIRSNKQHVSPGDVLISRINPRLNRTWVVQNNQGMAQIASTEWVVFPKSEGIEPRFLATLLSDSRIKDFLTANASGVGGSLTRVRPQLFDEIRIPVPPLNEQQRIVKRVEALFDEVDRGVESLRTARRIIALYGQSLLKSAFEGRLTADWRVENPDKLVSPDALLVQIREERERRYEAALDDWEEATAEWHAQGEQGKRPAKPKRPKSSHAVSSGRLAVPSSWITAPLRGIAFEAILGKMLDRQKNLGEPRVYLGNINLRWGRFNVDPGKKIPIEDHEVPRYGVRAGDLIVCEGGEPGRCAVWDGDSNQVFIQKALHRVRFTPSYSSRFAYYFFRFATVAGLLERHYTGSTIKHLTGTALAEVLLPICCPLEQTEIVRILDSRLEAAGTLDVEIEAGLARTEAFRQSIMRKAFSGQLVPQEPTEEPTSSLFSTPTPPERTENLTTR